jgi:hypothetical protein
MKKFVFIITLTLATVCFTGQSFAQGDISAPLLLFTNGAGSVSLFQGGQLLVVGQNYEMEGVPDSGFEFSSWQPVDVFTTFEVFEDISGNLQTNVNVISSPENEYTLQPVLDFTMQSVTLVLDTESTIITETGGWQVNFVPVPEPSCFSLIMCGLVLLAFFIKAASTNLRNRLTILDEKADTRRKEALGDIICL